MKKLLIVVAGLTLALGMSFAKKIYAEESQNPNEIILADFPDDFFFGLATAPAHVEEGLEDGWVDFARKGKVAAFNNQAIPEERLRFWTDYKTEIDLAASTGIKVFRMGVDWGRLVPNKPDFATCSSTGGVQNTEALKHYGEIVDYAMSKDMAIMMTLFHHSPPRWFMDAGGWPSPQASDCFVKFSKDVIDYFGDRVSYWVTFNEPAVYNMLVYAAGMWPPGKAVTNPVEMFFVPGVYKGAFVVANETMAQAHRVLYKYIHDTVNFKTMVGIAHNVGWHKALSPLDVGGVLFSGIMLNYLFMDLVADSIDYIGLNYYGAEYMRGMGIGIEEGVEYSDSGRAVDPYGLYALLKQFHSRYNVAFTNRNSRTQLPVIITENGVSESGDIIRPSYLIEHLLAIKQAMREGVNVIGYVYWTISDNWEWADGYCPKFGMFSVDRGGGLTRHERPYSVKLFKEIVHHKIITKEERDQAWDRVVYAQNNDFLRTMCRAADGKSSLDEPIYRPFAKVDWRFDLNNPSDQLDALAVLQVNENAEKLKEWTSYKMEEERAKLPIYVRDDLEREKVIKSITSIFNAFKKANFRFSRTTDGQLRVEVRNTPKMRTVCEVSRQKVATKFVFEDVFYLDIPQPFFQDKFVMSFHNVRFFLGPTRIFNWDISRWSYRIRVDKAIYQDGELHFISPDLNYLSKNVVNFKDINVPPPTLNCYEVDGKKYRGRFSKKY